MTDYFHGLYYGADQSYATMTSTNPKMCYDLVPVDLATDDDCYEPKGATDSSVEWADVDKLDWSVVMEGGDVDEKGIPLSWLAIKSEDEGRTWYQKHTKMPESMIDYVTRYYWGDGLEVPPEKTYGRTGRKKKAPVEKFQCHKGKFVVEF